MSQVLHAAFVCVKGPSVTLMDPTRCPGNPLGHSEPNNRVNNVHTEEGGSSQNQLIRMIDPGLSSTCMKRLHRSRSASNSRAASDPKVDCSCTASAASKTRVYSASGSPP